MKQKYTITVADMELNIISDAAPDEVENIVGILDRRMRDINLKSPRCTKNEAAILCALAYCSERISMQETFKKLEKDAFRFANENEKLKKTIEDLQEELDTVRQDAAVMRSILDRAAISVTPDPADLVGEKKYTPRPAAKPAETKAPEMEQISAFDLPYVEEPAVTAPAAEEPEQPKPQKTPGKSRVGSMFDLLTFSDV